ncbi:nitrilase-related carbon-nitrogen hydrolase [Alicyclobacillus sp. SO9]|uniref:nitrilase-related carbon-nitrogen hydrolase n=1 Tax=Alicyclobacillus sp. SO9 TaxID=2665646 RepID=UPI001E591547|nr:nitrilase-related carbon-nitrogen hydrolase [Alicyclobacillus sp. SO9]
MKQKRRLALAQIKPKLGDVEANLNQHMQYILEARKQNADVVFFPELGLTGYHVQDLVLDVARSLSHPDISALVAESQDIDIAFSFVEETPSHSFYISAVYASKGEIKSIHRKVYLATYTLFDESRYFAKGSEFNTFSGQAGSGGILICEDAWHVTSPYLLSLGGAQLLVLMASSPSRSASDSESFGSHLFWKRLLEVYAQMFGVHIAFVNRTGFEDGLNFFGGSAVVGPDGVLITEAPVLEESLVFADIDLDDVRRARYTVPLLRDERPDLVQKELRRLQTIEKGEFWR